MRPQGETGYLAGRSDPLAPVLLRATRVRAISAPRTRPIGYKPPMADSAGTTVPPRPVHPKRPPYEYAFRDDNPNVPHRRIHVPLSTWISAAIDRPEGPSMARHWGRDEATSSYGVPGPRARRGGLPDGTGLLRLYEYGGVPFSLRILGPQFGPFL